jgi:UDP-N-acetylmuramoyl-tripeptide--D-alanyl-D-alanine ligase
MKAVLVLIALASPLLTLLRLMQMKEWRWDRLKEHLEKEGYIRQLFGTTRTVIAALWLTGGAVLLFTDADTVAASEKLSILLLVTLAAATCMQIGAGRQRMPVWTAKALLVAAASAVMPMLALLAIHLHIPAPAGPLLAAVISLLAPLWALIGWALVLPVDSALKSRVLAAAERARLAHPHLTVIGITGSVGKTTMKELLSHLLKSKGAIATPEHVNTEIGVARWLTTVLAKEPADSTRILIVEMGAYRIGEIALLCRISRPTIGVITYVGTQHLTLFGSRENIIKAKGELFDALPENGKAFINADQDAFDALKSRARCPVISAGTGNHASVQALDIEETSGGTVFKAWDTVFRSPLAGTHSVTGVLLASTVANALGVTPQESARLMQSFVPLERTFQVKTHGGVTVLDDSYNSSPDSLVAAIQWAALRPESEKVLLVEGIIELGEEEEPIHRKLAAEAAPVFSAVYTAHARHLPYFAESFGQRARIASAGGPMKPGSLLVVCGRVSPAIVRRFLP